MKKHAKPFADRSSNLALLRGPEIPPKQFASAAEFVAALVDTYSPSGRRDPRLQHHAAATGSGESFPSEGGFLVAPEIAADWWQATYDVGQVLGAVTKFPVVSSFRIEVPAVDEVSRADGSRAGGIRFHWVGEGTTVTATKPKFRRVGLEPKKLMAISYATDELMMDAQALATWLRTSFASEAAFVIESEIVNGDGIGKPLGILNSDALITVDPESGQGSGTVLPANFKAMAARLWGPSRRRAVWLTCNDALAQVEEESFSNGKPVVTYDAEGNPRILGRPVMLDEYTPAVGTAGDVLLVDPSQYLIGEKEPGFASSIHVLFLYEENTFRWRFRIDGQPGWKSPVTPRNSTTTQSPFVALAARG